MEKEIEIPTIENLEKVLMGVGIETERWVWRIKGTEMVHHPYEPAVQFEDGDWAWYWMDQPHRWDGPALFWNGKYQYWIHGEELTKEEWERHLRRLEWLKTNKLRVI